MIIAAAANKFSERRLAIEAPLSDLPDTRNNNGIDIIPKSTDILR